MTKQAQSPKQIFAVSSNFLVLSTTREATTAPTSPTPNNRDTHRPENPCVYQQHTYTFRFGKKKRKPILKRTAFAPTK